MRKTLFIGLGGLGQRVVAHIKKQAQELKTSVEALRFIAIDRDDHDLEEVSFSENIPVIRLHDGQYIRQRLHMYHGLGVEDWFPDAPVVLQSAPHSTCLRAVGRLDFIYAVQENRLQPLTEMLEGMFAPENENQPLRIVVVTSLAGGTGSGMFIQLAAWLRKTVRMNWHASADICGVFAGPEVFIRTMQPGITACEQMRANAYAALQELELFTKVAEGAPVPGFEARMLDDQQLGAWEQSPIYDRIDMYEYREACALTFEQYLRRMAQSACLYYTSRLPETESPAVRQAGLRVRTMASGIAQYPQKEILEYCSLRAALELNRQKNQPLPAQELETLNRQANHLLKALMGQLQEELSVFTLPAEFFNKAKRLQKPREVDEFVHTALRELQRKNAEAEAMTAHCGEKLYQLTRESWLPEANLKASALLCGSGEMLTPTQLRALLELLASKLSEILRGVEEAPMFDICQPGTAPLPRGIRSVEPEAGTPYPLLVWEHITASPIRRLLSQTPKNYLEWFCQYSSEAMNQGRKAKETAILRQLLPLLLRELNELQRAMVTLEDELHRIFDRAWERHALAERQETLRVCADADAKMRIYGGCAPQWDMEAISSIYSRGLMTVYGERRWPAREGNQAADACAVATCKDILAYITKEVKQAVQQIDMDILEAWCYAENAGTNALSGLCGMLDSKTRENVINNGDGQLRVFGVSDACPYGQVLANLLGTQLLNDSQLQKTVLWCLYLQADIVPADSILPAWREAYEWMCRRARNAGEAHFEPHMDKRWSAGLFGVQ